MIPDVLLTAANATLALLAILLAADRRTSVRAPIAFTTAAALTVAAVALVDLGLLGAACTTALSGMAWWYILAFRRSGRVDMGVQLHGLHQRLLDQVAINQRLSAEIVRRQRTAIPVAQEGVKQESQ